MKRLFNTNQQQEAEDAYTNMLNKGTEVNPLANLLESVEVENSDIAILESANGTVDRNEDGTVNIQFASLSKIQWEALKRQVVV